MRPDEAACSIFTSKVTQLKRIAFYGDTLSLCFYIKVVMPTLLIFSFLLRMVDLVSVQRDVKTTAAGPCRPEHLAVTK